MISMYPGLTDSENLLPNKVDIRAASLSAILKNCGTLMKLWGLTQDNVSNSDMKARIIGVQTKMQTFSFFYGLQLAIVVLFHSDNLSSSLQRAELCTMDAQKMQALCHCSLRYTTMATQAAVKLELLTPSLPRHCKMPSRYFEGNSM